MDDERSGDERLISALYNTARFHILVGTYFTWPPVAYVIPCVVEMWFLIELLNVQRHWAFAKTKIEEGLKVLSLWLWPLPKTRPTHLLIVKSFLLTHIQNVRDGKVLKSRGNRWRIKLISEFDFLAISSMLQVLVVLRCWRKMSGRSSNWGMRLAFKSMRTSRESSS